MEFFQRREYNQLGFEYSLNFKPSDKHSDRYVDVLDLNLVGDFWEKWEPPINIFIHTSDKLIVSQTKDYLTNRQINLTMELFFLDDDEQQKFIITAKDADQQEEKFHIKIPKLALLDIWEKLLQGEHSEDILNEITDIYEKRIPVALYDIIEEASICLNIEDFFKVINILSRYSDSFSSEIASTRYQSFLNMCISKSKGKFHKIHSFPELQELISKYNSFENLKEIRTEKFIYRNIFGYIYSNRDTSKLDKIITHSKFLENCSSIDEKHFCYYLSKLIDSHKYDLDKARKLTKSWIDTPGDTNYWEEKEKLLGKNISMEEKPKRFRKLLFKATNLNNTEFMFMAANYIFWKASQYHIKSENLEIQPELFEISENIFIDLDVNKLAEKARYYYHISKGHQLKIENELKALSHYTAAIKIAKDTESDWKNSKYYHLVPPIRYNADIVVSIYKEKKEYSKGIKYLEETLNQIKNLEGVNPENKKYSKDYIKALLHEMKAHHILKNEQIETALKQAISELKKAIKYFSRIDNENLKNGAIARKYEIEALNAEIQGNFDKAADLHSKYIEVQKDSASGIIYHKAEMFGSKVKSAMLSQNYSKAKQILSDMEKEINLRGRHKALKALVEITLDYKDRKISDSDKVYKNALEMWKEDDDHPLHIKRDYTTAFGQILASQRLIQWYKNPDLLDALVSQSIKEAFIPKDINELYTEDLETDQLTNLSLDELWQEKLPLNVMEKIRSFELNQITSVDYDSLIQQLVVALEIHMALVVEYHTKKYCGKNWKKNIKNSEKSQVDINLTLGDYFSFFNTEIGQKIDLSDRIIEKDHTKIIDNVTINKIRNDLQHGNKLRIANSDSEYESIKNEIFNLMKILSKITPIPGTVESEILDTYYVRLLWSSSNKRVLIDTNKKLNSEKIYYFPPRSIKNKEKVEIKKENIVECQETKGLEEFLKAEMSTTSL